MLFGGIGSLELDTCVERSIPRCAPVAAEGLERPHTLTLVSGPSLCGTALLSADRSSMGQEFTQSFHALRATRPHTDVWLWHSTAPLQCQGDWECAALREERTEEQVHAGAGCCS